MGVLDLPKMIAEANKMQKQAKSVQVAGQHDSASMLIDGLVDWIEEDINTDIVMKKGNISEEYRAIVEKVIKITKEDLKKSFIDAKKQLNKKMSETMDLNELAGNFLGNKKAA